MNEEGWFKDPYRRHEARWMSDGTPTALVRDGGVESQDVPPDELIAGPLEREEPGTRANAVDLKRADDAAPAEPDYARTAADAFTRAAAEQPLMGPMPL
jgi:hypothetical protein